MSAEVVTVSDAGYARIRRGLLEHMPAMGAQAGWVYLWMHLQARYRGSERGTVEASVREIAAGTGLARSVVARALARLVPRYISVVQRGSGAARSLYHIVRFEGPELVPPAGQGADGNIGLVSLQRDSLSLQRDSLSLQRDSLSLQRDKESSKAAPGEGNRTPKKRNKGRRKNNPSARVTSGGDADARHAPARSVIQTLWCSANSGAVCPWDGREAASLARLLRGNPSWSMEQLKRCVRHRFASQVNHAERPGVWLPHLTDYYAAPLDRYKQPLQVEQRPRPKREWSVLDEIERQEATYPPEVRNVG